MTRRNHAEALLRSSQAMQRLADAARLRSRLATAIDLQLLSCRHALIALAYARASEQP